MLYDKKSIIGTNKQEEEGKKEMKKMENGSNLLATSVFHRHKCSRWTGKYQSKAALKIKPPEEAI